MHNIEATVSLKPNLGNDIHHLSSVPLVKGELLGPVLT